MKYTKPQSLTTDTRLSQSHFFNHNYLNKTNLTTTSSQKHHNLTNTFHNQLDESKQGDFLKIKNLQLQEKVRRMTNQVKQLEQNKVYLLKLNQKYIKVVNQYYRDINNKGNSDQHFNSTVDSGSIQKLKVSNDKLRGSEQQVNILQKQRSKTTKRNKSHSKYNSLIVHEQNLAQKVLTQLQKDHRNLIQHCLVMQNEIKNYILEMQKFNQMKTQLYIVNHTSPKQLISQLQQTTDQNKQLKKQNNRLSYQLEKSRSQCQKLKKAGDNQSKKLATNGDQAQKLRSQMIKVVQQSSAKSSHSEQRIYQLELKVEKLQKQLRNDQQNVIKHKQKRQALEIERVEHVHENSFLRANLSELLDPRKSGLLSLDRSFIYKQRRSDKAK